MYRSIIGLTTCWSHSWSVHWYWH